MRHLDLTSQRFTRLTVIDRSEDISKGQTRWNCVCDCGNKATVTSSHLTRGNSKSCGCLKLERLIERSTKHGHTPFGVRPPPTYHSWAGMTARCTNPKHRNYKDYGGRGITICEQWRTFAGFLADMGEKPPGTSIDRIDNNGNYEPDNCRWAQPKRQARNKSNNRLLTLNGDTRTLADWAEVTGIVSSTLSDRVRSGWSDEKALTTPVNDYQHRLTRNGITDTVAGWAKRLGVKPHTLYTRIHRGWPMEKVLGELDYARRRVEVNQQ